MGGGGWGETVRQELDTLGWWPGSLYSIPLSLFIHLEEGMIQVLCEVLVCNSSAGTGMQVSAGPL